MFYEREIPSLSILKSREKFYDKVKVLKPLPPQNSQDFPKGLEKGNKKTGITGKMFSQIYVWNLPMASTCPGKSQWCQNHCYNASSRKDVYDLKSWLINWWWVENNMQMLEKRIINQLLNSGENIAVRLHSSGDFYSHRYIDMWIRICKQCSSVSFWGYTRSWSVPELECKIKELSQCENVQLFASWDSTMPIIPTGLARSLVLDSNKEIQSYARINREKCFICPEQYNNSLCCAECGKCIKKTDKDVIFLLH